MIKNYLFTLCLFSFFLSYAQFQVLDDNGVPLPEGYVFNINTAEEDKATWKFSVRNTSDLEKIRIKLCCEELVNTTGDPFYLFFYTDYLHIHEVEEGECYLDEHDDDIMLVTDEDYELGMHNPEEGECRSWKFCVQQYDENDNKINEPFCFTYRYEPNLSINDIQLKNVNVYPTTIKNSFKVETTEQLALSIYNLSGKLVQEAIVNDNKKVLDLSQLSAQPYILNFINNKGQRYIKKITVE